MKTKMWSLVLVAALGTLTGTTGQCQNCGPTDPNPAIERIDFALVSQDSATAGEVEITATLINNGGGAYTSGENQQSLFLYEVPAGGGTAALVAQTPFQNLEPGERVTATYTLNWETSVEFPPSYRAVISYDPDIYIDGNPLNDDCTMLNNSLERSGTEINDLFNP